MRKSKEQKDMYIVRIRSLLVRKSDLSILEIQKLLATSPTSPLALDKDYINKLVNIIRKERTKRMDSHLVNTVLADFEDTVKELAERMWVILVDTDAKNSDKIFACKALIQAKSTLIDKMFDSGIFERQIGKLKTESALTPEDLATIDKAMENAFGRHFTKNNKKSEKKI